MTPRSHTQPFDLRNLTEWLVDHASPFHPLLKTFRQRTITRRIMKMRRTVPAMLRCDLGLDDQE